MRFDEERDTTLFGELDGVSDEVEERTISRGCGNLIPEQETPGA